MHSLLRHTSAVLAVLFLAAGLAQQALAQSIDTSAREAILMDAATGTVLLSEDPDVPMPPASMSKIMTVYLVFEALQDGRLTLDTKLPVSEKAWRMGGSKMFVEVGNQVRVEDLLRGVIVQSGNDACIVLAEGLAGSEAAFADRMTQKARDLGLTTSTFANATGWPHPDHRMTARELALLARHLMEDFPSYYHYFAETEFTWNEITQHNRNPLLYRSIGADGLKTGHTEEAGYGLTASAKQGDRRLILVVNGLESERARGEESERLLRWGFREFENKTLAKAGEPIIEAEVWLGQRSTVPLVAQDDVILTLPRASDEETSVTVEYEGPIPAPIEEGETIATLRVSAGGAEPREIPLQAGASVARLGPFGRIIESWKHHILGYSLPVGE